MIEATHAADARRRDSASKDHGEGTEGVVSNKRWLRPVDLMRRWGVSRQIVYHWRRRGYLPRATQIGPNAVAWRESDIVRWECERKLAVV